MLLLVLWFFLKEKFFDVDEELNKLECEARNEAQRSAIYGTVVRKFRNEDADGIRELYYFNGVDTLQCKAFYYEIDQFYDFILVNDSITKPAGSLQVTLIRDKTDTTHILRFNCHER